jgi:hypothetical protein
MSRQYYGIESLSLTVAQRQTLVDALQALGRNNQHPQPSHRNHWRVRPDALAVIFEGDFDDAHWTIEALTARLAAAFAVDGATISHTQAGSAYGPVVTFARPAGTPRLRMVAFGGLLATWAASHDAVLAYLAANNSTWEPASTLAQAQASSAQPSSATKRTLRSRSTLRTRSAAPKASSTDGTD